MLPEKISEPTSQKSRIECAICRECVTLEESKADECGQPVHEECYVSRVAGKTAVNVLMN